MPSFANPYQGNVQKKITKEELVQALRLDIASELEAIFLYDAHVLASDDPLVKKVLSDIRDEEVEHIGELTALVRYLDPSVDGFLTEGMGEVAEMMEELGITKDKIEAATGALKKDK